MCHFWCLWTFSLFIKRAVILMILILAFCIKTIANYGVQAWMGAGVVTTHIVKLLFVVLSTGEIGGEFFSDDRTGSAPTHTHTHSYIYIFCSNFEYFTMCEAEITLSRQIFIWINAFYDVNHNRNFFGFLLFCKMMVKRNQCDQMLDLKSCPNVFKSCLYNIHSSFYINRFFPKQPKSQQSFCATFEIEFVAKNFQKSPNLVTLSVIQLRGTQTSF